MQVNKTKIETKTSEKDEEQRDPYDLDSKDELESLAEEGQAALAAQPN